MRNGMAMADEATGAFLTPYQASGTEILGAVYDAGLRLVASSLRHSSEAAYRHRDPAFLFPREVATARRLDPGEWHFLGHSFAHWGHFLLETLPMAAVLLEDPRARGVMLPWGAQDELLNGLMGLLGLPPDRVRVHRDPVILGGEFRVRPRGVAINDALLDPTDHALVLERMRAAAARAGATGRAERLFVDRKPDRVPVETYERIASGIAARGFVRVRPETLPLAGQVGLFAAAREVAGFPGSHLHNVVFCRPDAHVIEIGEERTSARPLPNQLICAAIGGSRHDFVPYQADGGALLEAVLAILPPGGGGRWRLPFARG